MSNERQARDADVGPEQLNSRERQEEHTLHSIGLHTAAFRLVQGHGSATGFSSFSDK